jgi:hypothetical protein
MQTAITALFDERWTSWDTDNKNKIEEALKAMEAGE